MGNNRGAAIMLAAIALLLPTVTLLGARTGDQQVYRPPLTARLSIEVTGGDEKKAVPDASVYLKYVAVNKHGKEEKIELNLKTNQEGVTHSPEIPQGKVLIQIVAPGWKPFGQYYDAQSDDQTIQIHLERPTTKWYQN
jgi:hypothetical protein